MFQPAGVKTLMHMRSSLPVRPSTAAVLRTVPEDAEDVTASPRPSTAPAVSSLERRSNALDVLSAAVEEDQEEEEGSDDGGDPEPLLATASTTLHQLQNSWQADRRAELGQLCTELERAYGFQPSPGLLDEILTQRCGDAAESSAAVGSLEADPASASTAQAEGDRGHSEDGNEEDAGDDADAVYAAAAQQLESAKELRRRLEQRPRTPLADSAELGAALPGEGSSVDEAAALGQEGAADEDAKRLAALRWEVEKLKVKAEQPAEQSPPLLEECEDRIRSMHAPVLDTKPISELGALDQWIQDMRKFCRDADGKPACPSSPSRAKGGAVSKKAMAQIAETRAMEWAAEKEQRQEHEWCRSPSGGSPATARCGAGTSPSGGRSPSNKAASLLSPTASTSGRATVATPLNGRAALSPGSGAKEEKSAIEQQLDDILSEFDEIDRIHSNICKLTRA